MGHYFRGRETADGHAARGISRAAARRPVRALQYVSEESDDWLYYAYFPKAKTRDFADFWPPDAIVSEMIATGFTGVEVERRHVHGERDLAELLSAVRFRERTSQLLSL
jgi:hypothetical protein